MRADQVWTTTIATVRAVGVTVHEAETRARRIAMGSPAIRISGLNKTFRLPRDQAHTLKERALHPFRKREFDHSTRYPT